MDENKPSLVVKPLYRVTQVVWYVFYIVETILLFRFLMKLVGANPGAGFTQFVYRISFPLVSPFLYVINPSLVTSPPLAQSVIEWSSLLALFVYWIVAWAVVSLLVMWRPISRTDADQKLNEQDVR